ncbi:MAG TPA: hypothetical protein VFT72_06730 [Opitutaceae bacterium]|nr:hypothetical protein [Opitutaceae bacterium]
MNPNNSTSISSSASEVLSEAKQTAATLADKQRSNVANSIGNAGSAIHRSAESIEGQDPNIGWLTHRVADRLNNVADYLRGRDLTQLKNDAEDMARRHPALFLGGLFVAGLVIGNLAKATQRSSSYNDNGESYPRAEDVPEADQPELDPWPSPAAQGETL